MSGGGTRVGHFVLRVAAIADIRSTEGQPRECDIKMPTLICRNMAMVTVLKSMTMTMTMTMTMIMSMRMFKAIHMAIPTV